MNRSLIRDAAPRVRVSSAPLTDSVSSIWTLRSASRRWRSAVILCRSRATRRVSQIAGGSTSSESSDSRHDSAAIATAVPTTTVTLEAIEVAVEVTTFCTPLMSLVSRDCTSPPRALVKKPTDWRCRRSNSPVRRSCITRWPTVVDSQVCTTPIIAVAAAMPTIAPTSHSSSATSCWGSASSIKRRTRNGWARPIAELATIRPTTTASRPLKGASRRAIRRSETGESASCRLSARTWFGSEPELRRPRPVMVRSST